MNKIIIAIVIVAVILVGGYFFLRGSQPSSREREVATPLVPEQPSGQTTPQPPISQTPVVEEKIVTYTDAGFSPTILRVKAGETVTFKNQSSNSMWTASAVHPTHRGYPTTGGCIGSTFDACQGVQPGGLWSFKFNTAGTWKYHNHLSPGDTGTIVVE